MTTALADTLLSEFSHFLGPRIGLHFPPDRFRDLERGVGTAASELGFADAAACMDHFLSNDLNQTQIEILASHLTVGETYFYREPQTFDVLARHVLPELIARRRMTSRILRIWSAGCCTGEEAYSIAILLDGLIPDLDQWTITILGTDINPRFLARANLGVYSEWSFRGIDSNIRESYFIKTDDKKFNIIPRIKKMVTFSYHNLATDNFPSVSAQINAMDIIFCRNVLMYFTVGSIAKVIERFHRSLMDDGWMVASSVEVSPMIFTPFVYAGIADTPLYRKTADDRSTPASQILVLETPTPAVPSYALNHEPAFPIAPSTPAPEDTNHATMLLYEQGRYSEAAERLSALLSTDSGDTKAMILLARCYANQGRLVDACRWCQQALKFDRLAPGHHYLMAMILQERGDTNEATASLKRALFLDSEYVLAHFSLAVLAQSEGKFALSKKHFENTLALLEQRADEQVLADSDGMTVRRLTEIVRFALVAVAAQ